MLKLLVEYKYTRNYRQNAFYMFVCGHCGLPYLMFVTITWRFIYTRPDLQALKECF